MIRICLAVVALLAGASPAAAETPVAVGGIELSAGAKRAYEAYRGFPNPKYFAVSVFGNFGFASGLSSAARNRARAMEECRRRLHDLAPDCLIYDIDGQVVLREPSAVARYRVDPPERLVALAAQLSRLDPAQQARALRSEGFAPLDPGQLEDNTLVLGARFLRYYGPDFAFTRTDLHGPPSFIDGRWHRAGDAVCGLDPFDIELGCVTVYARGDELLCLEDTGAALAPCTIRTGFWMRAPINPTPPDVQRADATNQR